MKRFSSLLLSGKVASLPMLMQNAYAQYNPSFNDALNQNLTQIQVPQPSAVILNSIGSPAYGSNNTSLNGSAQICSNKLPSSPANLSVVLTGLQPNDTIFIATATSQGGNESLNSKIKLGTQRLYVAMTSLVSGPKGSTLSLTMSIPITDLIKQGYPISSVGGGTFFMQSIAFPSGSVNSNGIMDWSKARVSELDTISVAPCSVYSTNTYGSTY